MVHGCMVYMDCTKVAAVSHGTSHVTTEQHWKHTASADIQNKLQKATATHLGSHSMKSQWVWSELIRGIVSHISSLHVWDCWCWFCFCMCALLYVCSWWVTDSCFARVEACIIFQLKQLVCKGPLMAASGQPPPPDADHGSGWRLPA